MSAQCNDVDEVVIQQRTQAVAVWQGRQTGLFDCFDDDCESFCCSAWFPSIVFANIADIVDQGSECPCVHLTCYQLGAVYLGVWWCNRSNLRQLYGLPETPLPDWLTHLLFHWCALAQEYRELAARGFDVNEGWEGRPQPAATTTVPRVQAPMTRY